MKVTTTVGIKIDQQKEKRALDLHHRSNNKAGLRFQNSEKFCCEQAKEKYLKKSIQDTELSLAKGTL